MLLLFFFVLAFFLFLFFSSTLFFFCFWTHIVSDIRLKECNIDEVKQNYRNKHAYNGKTSFNLRYSPHTHIFFCFCWIRPFFLPFLFFFGCYFDFFFFLSVAFLLFSSPSPRLKKEEEKRMSVYNVTFFFLSTFFFFLGPGNRAFLFFFLLIEFRAAFLLVFFFFHPPLPSLGFFFCLFSTLSLSFSPFFLLSIFTLWRGVFVKRQLQCQRRSRRRTEGYKNKRRLQTRELKSPLFSFPSFFLW